MYDYLQTQDRAVRAAFPDFVPTHSPTHATPAPTRLQRLLNWLRIRDISPTQSHDWDASIGNDRLEDQDYQGPLYLVNMSNTTDYVTHSQAEFGQIMVQTNDKHRILVVPATWYPVDIGAYREVLRGCRNFRRVMDNGLVQFVSPQRARMIMESPEGVQEMERLKIVCSPKFLRTNWGV